MKTDYFFTHHFQLSEFTGKLSKSAISKLPLEHLNNILKLAQIMNIIRCHCETPIRITSGYRTEKHNAKVGGVPTSEHLTGSACDFQFILNPEKDYDVCQEQMINNIVEFILYNVEFGQLIHYENFLHISLKSDKHNCEYIDKRYITEHMKRSQRLGRVK